ncbi:putative T6SS immunity periplasmic lipoprotein [Serratia rubidaea]|uniref:putative T6SS immunity periplasmic lipoprotein n=1 Tax=Serratia rubidaea TaxID=61652 RepID=UPI00242BC625|nr:putative T6SS immunity periplasmic lipoprotein [Serratia rubidaea]MCR0999727.1 hypothetical protein [Serratia rubidaea]
MKYLFLLMPAMLLAGCTLGDPGPKISPVAETKVVNNNICLLAPIADGESMSALEIRTVDPEKNLRKHFASPFPLSSTECIPLFGYRFQAGHNYGVFVNIEQRNAQERVVDARIIRTSFRLWQDKDGKLQVITQAE